MHTSIICSAVLDNELQIKNLCDCIMVLGGEPTVIGNAVITDYYGEKTTADKFIELFNHCTHHGISVIS